MTETNFVLPQRSPGRLYQQAKDMIVNEKLDNQGEYVQNIANNLKSFLMVETAVRFLLDGPHVQPTVATVSVPFEGDADTIYSNLGTIIFNQMWGYYLSGDPKSTHHGITTLVLEGSETSLIRREAEKFLRLTTSRNELGARVMRNYTMACDVPAVKRDTFFRRAAQRGLDIHLGVRLFTFGEGVERQMVFLPMEGGKDAIDLLYYNLENIIQQNLIAYDEQHDHYLPVTEELVFRELESVLNRARTKENTRKKIINGLRMHTMLQEDPTMNNHISIADLYYDKLNRIDLMDEASQRSREMYASSLIRATEITNAAGIKLDELQMSEQVYIDPPQPQAQPEPVTVDAGGQPAQQGDQQQGEPAPAAPATDGLEEL